MNVLAEILSSRIRAEIFRILFGISNGSLHMREIKDVGLSIGTIQQELKKLVRLELVRKKKDGNRLYYEANQEHPLYPDICYLVLKTVGLTRGLKECSEAESNDQVGFCFWFHSRHAEKGESDVDLMVIGDIGMRQLTGFLSGVSAQIGREINPHVFCMKGLRDGGDRTILTQVLESPKIFIIGNEDELKAVA